MAEEVNVQLILLVVLAILSLWWVVHTLRQHWSTEPAEPEVARCNFWFRQRETYQFWLVVCVFFSAVLLLSALAADQYGVYNQRTSSPYYQWEKRADVGAFVQKISEMSMGLRPDGNFVDQTITYHISWKQACEAESDGIRRGKCETARAGSIVMFTMLLAALLLLVAALGLMARTNVTFHRAQARIREAVANGQRRLGLQPDGPGWANLPPPELPVLLCQLVTPAVARCIGLVFWLLLFAGLTHALIVYTSFYGWSSNYDSKNTYFKASWFLVEVLVIPLFLAKMFVDAQLRYGARPDYSKLQSFPSAIRGDGLEAELLDPDTGLPLPLPLPLPVGGAVADLEGERHGEGDGMVEMAEVVPHQPPLIDPQQPWQQQEEPFFAPPPAFFPQPHYAEGTAEGQPSYSHLVVASPSQPSALPADAAAAAPAYGHFVAPTIAALPVPAAGETDEGQPPSPPVAGAAGRPRFCPFCGGGLSGLPAGARFCGDCGQPWA